MKQTIAPKETPLAWDPEALYVKAERYAQQMIALDSNSWECALWSSLSLELLARSALANVSPALLADSEKSLSSLFHSLGFTPTESRFSPRSIATNEVFKRLASILPGFIKEYEDFGIVHTGRRNAELHTGDVVFDGLPGSRWRAKFYEVCASLLASMGLSLSDFLGQEESYIAEKIIGAAADEGAKAVKDEVEAHKKVWHVKETEQQATLIGQAKLWASRQAGHCVNCPACRSPALVSGERASASTRKLVDDEITESQEYLPSQFECIACGLRISGLSRLTVIGLGDRYKQTKTYDAAAYYAPEDDYAGYEEDNNEP